MNDPQDHDEFAETKVLDEDLLDDEVDPDATAVLGDEYRRKIESGAE